MLTVKEMREASEILIRGAEELRVKDPGNSSWRALSAMAHQQEGHAEICERLDTLIAQGKPKILFKEVKPEDEYEEREWEYERRSCNEWFREPGPHDGYPFAELRCNNEAGHEEGKHFRVKTMVPSPQGQSVEENLAGMQEYVRELECAAQKLLMEVDISPGSVNPIRRGFANWGSIAAITREVTIAVDDLKRVLNIKTTQATESGTGEDAG